MVSLNGIKNAIIKSSLVNGKAQITPPPPKTPKPQLTYDKDVFFINMKKYKKNDAWADGMLDSVYKLSSQMSEGKDFSEILNTAEKTINGLNSRMYGKKKMLYSLFALKKRGRGAEYYTQYKDKLKHNFILKPKANTEYEKANTCFINNFFNYILINYGWRRTNKISNLDLVKHAYEKLNTIKSPTIDDVNKTAATIHWLIAQECPYERGNDSMANLLTKAIYHKNEIKVSPFKESVSADFEAFYRDLDDYIKVYPTLFEKMPYKEA